MVCLALVVVKWGHCMYVTRQAMRRSKVPPSSDCATAVPCMNRQRYGKRGCDLQDWARSTPAMLVLVSTRRKRRCRASCGPELRMQLEEVRDGRSLGTSTGVEQWNMHMIKGEPIDVGPGSAGKGNSERLYALGSRGGAPL